MEQNPIHSPEAATDEPAFLPTPEISLPEQLVSPSLNRTFPPPEPVAEEPGRRARRHRHDGWTPERQIGFLEALAACGVVADACKRVGLSAQSAYAFRNRRSGRAFGTAWEAVLIHRARGRLSDEVLSRSMNGCIEAIHQNGEIVGERHRFDNRLSMAVLTRLDRLAEKEGHREDQLRAVSEDLDDLLDCIEEGGDADAFIEARRPQPESNTPFALSLSKPVLSDAAGDVEGGCLSSQDRKEGQGFDKLSPNGGFASGQEQPDSAATAEDELDDPLAVQDDEWVWFEPDGRLWTTFPPPAGFDGEEKGVFDGVNYYARTLDAREQAAYRGKSASLHTQIRVRRDRYFGYEGGDGTAAGDPAPAAWQASTSSTYPGAPGDRAVEAPAKPDDMRGE